jgi:hypothetical protein
MKKILILLSIIFMMTACSEKHVEMAEKYKLDLNYYENSVRFSGLNMNEEAYTSCLQTTLLRSECFTTLVQELMSKDIAPEKSYCDEIMPEQKMEMSMKAFEFVYKDIDDELKEEFKEKINPSEKRIEALKKIKEECYKKANNG